MKALIPALLFLAVSTTASAELQCSAWSCDVKWKTQMGEIDLSTVCYNYEGKAEYQECRQLAVEVFEKRCERAKAKDNSTWKEIYCEKAVPNYQP